MKDEPSMSPHEGGLARFFVEHREVGWLALIAVLIWGGIALFRLPQQEDPKIPERSALVVTALPWFALGALLPDVVPKARKLRAAPIVSAYVTMPENEPPLPDDGPVTALVDGAPFHFVLRRPGDDPRHVAMLSGGDRSFDGQTVAAIVERARAQLARWYPGSRMANAQVVVRKESLATFVPACGSRVLRPAPGRVAGGPANLRLCGDWTDTGFPATLEGACRSALTMLREFAR